MLHQIHVAARHISHHCKWERSIASPQMIFYLASTVPICFLHVRVNVYSHLRKLYSLLVTGSVRPCQQSCVPFYCVIFSVANGFPSHMNPNITRESYVTQRSSVGLAYFQATQIWTHCYVPPCPQFYPVFRGHRLRVSALHSRTSDAITGFCLRARHLPRSHFSSPYEGRSIHWYRLRRPVPFRMHRSRIRRLVLPKHHRNSTSFVKVSSVIPIWQSHVHRFSKFVESQPVCRIVRPILLECHSSVPWMRKRFAVCYIVIDHDH